VSWAEIRHAIPNALTIARFAAIPVFVWLYLDAGDGPAWGAGVFFAAAALTDQLDGYLARRWRVESRFGQIADPLADRLMIGTAAGTTWPLVILWIGIALSLAAGAQYALGAWREVRAGRDSRREREP